ncbi:MAG: hypothetical protein QOE51_1937 [Actinoplanes sp.]|jgi:subtilisin family serine protease|nr:hypothetical protein [Actinoplanes sp.]
MNPRRLSVVLLAVGTAAGLTVAVTVPATATAIPAQAGTPAPTALSATPVTQATSVSVTLITGDTVTVSPHGTAVDPAPGRARIPVERRTMDGDQYVIPADALPLLRSGRLDERLFDITALQKFGYTGGRDLPLLVQYPKSGASKGSARARAFVTTKARVSRDLTAVRMLAVHAPHTAQAGLWTALTSGTSAARALRPGVERVYLDGKLQLSDDVSDPQVGAPTAWQQGLDGTGVTVAVLDSGIDATHPEFAGKIVASENFTEDPSTDDTVGHGTHVASIIAGSGAESGGRYKGVAPGAKLAIGKVCDLYCGESAVLAGMQWAAHLAPVVNMSLAGGVPTPDNPVTQAVDDLTAADGTLFVIAAGNAGRNGSGTIGVPGVAAAALTVGSVDSADQIAPDSSRGPLDGSDATIKPDITAPGVGIIAARAANGTLGEPVGNGYVRMSGTSMATPHVAGAAAIITQQHPGWSPAQRKTLLMGAAQPTAGTSVYTQGAGRLDIARAVGQSVSADEGSLSFGTHAWPHDHDTPVSKTLTYRNSGTAAITLTLAVQGDTDTFSMATTSLTVPAGGAASTMVTSDTSGAGTDGLKSGWVVATAGDVRVETPLGVDRGVEMHDVTIHHIGRDGQPNTYYDTWLIGLNVTNGKHTSYEYYLGEQAQTIPVIPGTYGVVSLIYGTADTTMLVQRELVISDTTSLTLDSRLGRPVRVTPPRADARQALAEIDVSWNHGEVGAGTESFAPADTYDLYTAQIGPAAAADDGFQSTVHTVFAQWKNDTEEFADSPYVYDTNYGQDGAFPTGFDKRISQAELTTVKQRFAREADGATGVAYNWPYYDKSALDDVALPFTLPFERTAYLGGAGRTRWTGAFKQQVQTDPDSFPTTITEAVAPDQQFQPGTVVQQDWNQAVFAPSVAYDTSLDYDTDVATRKGDTVAVNATLFDDSAGHTTVAPADTARTALYADGTLVNDLPSDHGTFTVPAAPTNYRLEMSATRAAPVRLSTSVSGVWTFSSRNGDSQLPLSTVRFRPHLNSANAAPTGAFTVPVTLERTTGSTAGHNRTLTAEFSIDDGKTWQPATVTGSSDQRALHVTNPATGYVSLRVAATDTAGNTAAVTVLRAYAIG